MSQINPIWEISNLKDRNLYPKKKKKIDKVDEKDKKFQEILDRVVLERKEDNVK